LNGFLGGEVKNLTGKYFQKIKKFDSLILVKIDFYLRNNIETLSDKLVIYDR